jgi:ATP-binding cassette subfamily B (MDR/TAP) protein 1
MNQAEDNATRLHQDHRASRRFKNSTTMSLMSSIGVLMPSTAARLQRAIWNKYEESRKARVEQFQLHHVPSGTATPGIPQSPRNSTAQITYATLYRYATPWDIGCLTFAATAAVAAGAALPLMSVIVGNLSGSFADYFNDPKTSDISAVLKNHVVYFVYLAAGEFVLIYLSTVLFVHTGERLASMIRTSYLQAILAKDIAFFDHTGAGEVTTRLTADTNSIQEAISEKVALILNGIASFIAAFVIGFVRFWRLTAICMSTVFAIILAMGVSSYYITLWNRLSLDQYAAGGNVAEETINSIRVMKALNTQKTFASAYDKHLQAAMRWSIRSRVMLACMIGSVTCIVFLNYGLAFWMGGRFIASGETDKAAVLTIIMAIMMGIFAVGNLAPNIQYISAGVAAGSRIFGVIDGSSSHAVKSGAKLEFVRGDLELRNVRHTYPTRPSVIALDNVSFTIPAGKTTAIVGYSGSGKSSILSLIERFYDPVSGVISLDGHDIGTLDVHWLRRQIAFVGQEPVLFNKSIRENIADGIIDSPYESETQVQQEKRIIEAAKQANIHDFISLLPGGYDSLVGEKGVLLSGGQKQRIAIARAIVRNPKILLLDEATSALDTSAENMVQAALETAAANRTTVVVAHRLSTIRNADKIVVLDKGAVVEEGNHQFLLDRDDVYAALVASQRLDNLYDSPIPKLDQFDFDWNAVKTSSWMFKDHIIVESEEATPTNLTWNESSTAIWLPPAMTVEKSSSEGKSSLWLVVKFIATLTRQDLRYMILGLIFSIISGAAQPVQGVFFAQAIVALSQPFPGSKKFQHTISFWAWMNVMIAMIQLIVLPVQGLMSAICTERLVFTARSLAFRCITRKEIAFFDLEENSTGALTSFLSTKINHLSTLSSQTLNILVSCLSTIIIAVIVSMAVGWKLAIVCLCTVPAILGTGYLRVKSIANFQKSAQAAYQKSAGFACEYINAIRTVASLTMEGRILEEYCLQIYAHTKSSLRSTLLNSAYYAASQSMIFLALAIRFWYGGILLTRGDYTLLQVFLILSEIIFSTRSAGTAFAFAGDIAKGGNAAAEIRELFYGKAITDECSEGGQAIERIEGHIEFRGVHFRYAARPDAPVLQGLSMTVQAGQSVALVGSSGSGKSTVIALLERFYEPLAGGIYLDGRSITSLNLNDLRKHIALVSQEPLMYQGTIKDNLLLGFDTMDNAEAIVPEQKIIEACKEANIYDFIQSLP